MTLLVSIHDVTPALERDVFRLWDMCASRGVAPALLVVPDWQGRWPLHRFPAFTHRLRSWVLSGAEIVLHGERHSHGEFAALDRSAALQRIHRGLEILRSLDLEPVGFVAPQWKISEEGHAAVGDAGLRFSEDARCIRLLPTGRRIPSPAVRWSARTAVRAWGSVAVARGRWLLQRRAPYPRLAFHPQDSAHPRAARDLAPTLDRWLSRHVPARYSDLAANDDRPMTPRQ